jgi:large subunit ribosomal protein L20
MRVKTGTTRRARHKKVLSRTKGFRMTKGRLYKVSKEADLHAGQYAYAGRRLRKRDLRRLWIQRINAGLSQIDGAPKYSRFINLLKAKNVLLNRKIMADLVVSDPKAFEQIVNFINS